MTSLSSMEAVPARRSLARTGHRWLVLAAALFVVTLAPLVYWRIPALVDYPNHLARIYVLTHLATDPLLQQFYAVDWRAIPDLAMDIVVTPLSGLVGLYAAGTIFMVLAVAIAVSGIWALHIAIHRRASVGLLLVFPLLYTTYFIYGFLNYYVSIGLAAWGAAFWIARRDTSPLSRGLVSMLVVLVTYFSHLYGVALYGLIILCYEIERLRGPDGRYARPSRTDLATFSLPFVLALVLLAFNTGDSHPLSFGYSLFWKFSALLFVFSAYWPWFGALFMGVATLGVTWGVLEKRIELPRFAVLALLIGLAFWLVLPFKLLGSHFADARLLPAMTLLFVAFARWRFSPRETAIFCLLVGGITLARLAEVQLTWTDYEGSMAAMDKSFAKIEPGSRLLIAGNDDWLQLRMIRGLRHFPSMATIERSAMVTLEFTNPAGQLLRVKPAYRRIKPDTGTPVVTALVAADVPNPDDIPDPTHPEQEYWLGWRRNYDYLYVLYTKRGDPPPSPELTLVDEGDEFQLYRIPATE